MAVLPADLKAANGGRIEPGTMFPEESSVALDQRLQKYIDEGLAKAVADGLSGPAEQDAATKAWAYHRAFDAVFIRLSSNPSSVTLNDQGGSSFLVTQIQNFKDLAFEALGEYDVIVEGAQPGVDTGWNTVSSLRHA